MDSEEMLKEHTIDKEGYEVRGKAERSNQRIAQVEMRGVLDKEAFIFCDLIKAKNCHKILQKFSQCSPPPNLMGKRMNKREAMGREKWKRKVMLKSGREKGETKY